jgi:hypothetical protein
METTSDARFRQVARCGRGGAERWRHVARAVERVRAGVHAARAVAEVSYRRKGTERHSTTEDDASSKETHLAKKA